MSKFRDDSGQFILDFLVGLGYSVKVVADCKDLFTAGILNSIRAVRLAVAIEKKYGIHFRTGEISFDHFRSVRHLARFVEDKQKKA